MDNDKYKTIESESSIKPDESPPDHNERVMPCELDSKYIKHYLNKTKAGKTAALQAAYIEAGMNRKATRGRAWDMHNRLRNEINKQLLIQSDDDKALGRNVLRELCKSADSESVRASTAQTLAKGLYPDVKPVEAKTIDDLDSAISDNIKQIAQDEGKSINQVIDELQSPVQH